MVVAMLAIIAGGVYYTQLERLRFTWTVDALGKQSKYTVMTSMSMPDASANYIEVNTPDGNYTEYPYNSQNKEVKTGGDTTKGQSYVMQDWLTNDNKLYEINPSYNSGAPKGDTNTIWISMPDSYAQKLKDRKTLYGREIASGLYDIKKDAEVQMDLKSSGKSTVQMYKAKVKSSVVKEIMKKDSYDLYFEILKQAEQKKDKEVTDWINTNLTKLDRNLTFSDGDITYGVCDGQLVYWEIEVGGLGSQMKMVKKVILEDGETRSLPDFSNCSDMYNQVKTHIQAQGKAQPNADATQGTAQPQQGTTSQDASKQDGSKAQTDSKKDVDTSKQQTDTTKDTKK